jgi:hypothetical protein
VPSLHLLAAGAGDTYPARLTSAPLAAGQVTHRSVSDALSDQACVSDTGQEGNKWRILSSHEKTTCGQGLGLGLGLVFWVMTTCSLVGIHRPLRRTYTFLVQDQRCNSTLASRSLVSQHIFDPEDGDSTFTRNFVQLVPEYTAHVPEYNTLRVSKSTNN